MINAIEAEEFDLVGSHMDEFIDNHMQPDSMRKVPIEPSEIISKIFWSNPFNHPSVAFRIEQCVRLGTMKMSRSLKIGIYGRKMLAEGSHVGNIDKSLVLFRSGKRALARRRGLSYAKNEFSFFKKLYMNSTFMGDGLPGVINDR